MQLDFSDIISIRALLDYCHGSVFDKACGDSWKKTNKFLTLLLRAEKDYEKVSNKITKGGGVQNASQ